MGIEFNEAVRQYQMCVGEIKDREEAEYFFLAGQLAAAKERLDKLRRPNAY